MAYTDLQRRAEQASLASNVTSRRLGSVIAPIVRQLEDQYEERPHAVEPTESAWAELRDRYLEHKAWKNMAKHFGDCFEKTQKLKLRARS